MWLALIKLKRIQCSKVELNHRHMDFQSIALPLSYLNKVRLHFEGIEPSTDNLEGYCSSQLS